MSEPIANAYATLAADAVVAGIVADRIYAGKAEQTAQPPFVVWQLIANTPGLQLAGRPTYDAQLLQVDAYSRDPVEARSLAFACRDALEAHAHVTRGPVDVPPADDVDGLQRWTLDVSYVWERGNG